MEITPIYIISQIVAVIYFAILGVSYLLKKRTHILFANFLGHIGQAISMLLLGGYTGAAMSVIMLLRDLILFIQENKRSKGKTINEKSDLLILIITIILVIILTAFTYDGPLSLLSVAATLVATYALWQKNVKIYKILGLIVCLLWLFYNIFVMSIIGIILELALTVCSTIGYLKERRISNT